MLLNKKIVTFWAPLANLEITKFFIIPRKTIWNTDTMDDAIVDVHEWITNVNQNHGSLFSHPLLSGAPNIFLSQRPSVGSFKCNFDVLFDITTRHVQGGWIVRDFLGNATMWGSRF